MILPGDAFFYWRSSGPDILVGVIVTIAVAVLGYLASRSPKGRVAVFVLFGAWTLYVPFVFIGSRIWPDEISISAQEIHGRHNFSRFALKVADIRFIQGARLGRGGYALHVFLKSTNNAVGIPVVWDQNKEAYKSALHQVRPDADLDW